MNLLRLARKVLHLNQQEAAQKFEVSRQLWAYIESDSCLPSAKLAASLAEAVGLVPHQDEVLSGREIRLLIQDLRPYEFELAHPEPWRRAAKNWAYPISRLETEPRTRTWMEKLMVCHSAIEAYGWLQLASLNGHPQISNPHELGFRELPITDGRGKALGERRLAGLRGKHLGLRFLTWPQVHLRPGSVTYAVDGLVWIRWGNRSSWAILEFDGPRHNAEDDEFRERQLGLPAIRIRHTEVTHLKVKTLFLKRVAEILGVADF